MHLSNPFRCHNACVCKNKAQSTSYCVNLISQTLSSFCGPQNLGVFILLVLSVFATVCMICLSVLTRGIILVCKIIQDSFHTPYAQYALSHLCLNSLPLRRISCFILAVAYTLLPSWVKCLSLRWSAQHCIPCNAIQHCMPSSYYSSKKTSVWVLVKFSCHTESAIHFSFATSLKALCGSSLISTVAWVVDQKLSLSTLWSPIGHLKSL